jgi:hypothetical protein
MNFRSEQDHLHFASAKTVTEKEEVDSSKNITHQRPPFKTDERINKEDQQMEDGLHIKISGMQDSNQGRQK